MTVSSGSLGGPHHAPRSRSAASRIGCLLVAASCACASTEHRSVVLVDPSLPAYSPSEASLFDDSIAPAVYTTRPDADPSDDPARDGSIDPKLIERTRRADTVFPARIVTVKRPTRPGGRVALVLEPLEAPLIGEAPTGPVAVSLAQGTALASRTAADGGALLVGRRVLVFLRRYAGRSGVELHFRAEPDQPALRRAVGRAAKALDDGTS
jgi:hypothetical protein